MKKRDLRHINLYKDKHGQTILYNAKKKQGYIIPDNEVGRVSAMQYRGFLVLSVGIILYFLFNVAWWITAIAMIGLLVLTEIIYRKSMLSKYRIINNYTPLNILDKSVGAYKQNSKSMLSRIALYGLIGFLLVASIIGQPLDKPETQILLVVAAFAIVNSLYHIFIFIKKRS